MAYKFISEPTKCEIVPQPSQPQNSSGSGQRKYF